MNTSLRSCARVTALALLPLLAACEDPIIFVGDLPGIMRIVAGVPTEIGENVDSLARSTEMNEPRGIALDDDGTLYIADSRNSRILAVSPAGALRVLTDSTLCTSVCLARPRGVAVAPDGSIWIADELAHRLFRLEPVSRTLEVRAGTGVAGSSPDGTPGLEAMLNAPSGIAVTSGGVVYFTERDGHRVRWLTTSGHVRTIAGTGERGFSEGSPATEARLDSPEALALHGSLLYVADTQNDRVRVINLVGGGIRTIAGIGVAGYAQTDSVASSAKLNRPRAVAVSTDGERLFIGDGLNHRVRVVDLDENRISTFAGTGDPAYTDEGLDAPATSLSNPSGLATHRDGVLFISDTGHQVVWMTRLRF